MAYPEPSIHDHGAPWNEDSYINDDDEEIIICACSRCVAARKKAARDEACCDSDRVGRDWG